VCSSVFGRAFDSLTDNVTGHKLITREPRRFSFTRFAERRIEITTARRRGRVADEASANYSRRPRGRYYRNVIPPADRSVFPRLLPIPRRITRGRYVPRGFPKSKLEAEKRESEEARLYANVSRIFRSPINRRALLRSRRSSLVGKLIY